MLTGPGGRNDYSFCMSRCIAHAYSRRTETLAPRSGARPESATGRDPAAHRQAGVPKATCSVARWRFVWGTEGAVYMTTDGSICRTSVIRTSGTTEVHSVGITSMATAAEVPVPVSLPPGGLSLMASDRIVMTIAYHRSAMRHLLAMKSVLQR